MMASHTPTDFSSFTDFFNDLFSRTHNVLLLGAEGDPLYRPASGSRPAEIRYVKDSLASALHEVAHWCVAGKARHKLEDYGYWYRPDGRSLDEQRAFELVEVRPQASEWVLSKIVGRRFVVSCDNLGGQAFDVETFRERIAVQAYLYATGNAGSQNFKDLVKCLWDQYQPDKAEWARYWHKVSSKELLPDLY